MVGDLKAVLLDGALSPASRDQLKTWMIATQTGLAKLRAGLPASWTVGDKTGNNGGGTSNDIAIAWAPAGPMVIACYLTGADTATAEARDAAIASVGHLVAETFAAKGPARRG